jgi:hypothetical protein
MNNLKKITALFALVAFSFSMLNLTNAEASDPPKQVKFPNQITCGNAQGQVTGIGNDCTVGGNFCIPNPCNDQNN